MNWIILIIAGFCETGVAYSVWTGIGAVGAVLLGIFVFHEPATFWRIFFLTTLILSIVGLKYVG